MITAYVHVGLHKTGTTSLQRYFRKEKVILYNPEPLFEWKEGEVSPKTLNKTYTEDALFIYEQLSWLTDERCKLLIDNIRMKFDSVVVILISRNKQELAISHKNQSVKSIAPGAYLERKMYGLSYNTREYGSPSYIDIENHKKKWWDTECDNLIVLSFEDEVKKGNILDSLHDILNLYPPKSNMEKINESLPYSKFIINTHAFRTVSERKKLKKIINEVNRISFVGDKVPYEEEVIVNKGIIQVMDLFLVYLEETVDRKLSGKEIDKINEIKESIKDDEAKKILDRIVNS